MIELLTHYIAPLMFLGLIFFMVIGYPGILLAAVGLFFGLIAIELGLIAPISSAISSTSCSVLSNELLLAIPFFTFMGVILERCGPPRICSKASASCWRLRGGLSYAVILVGAISAHHRNGAHR